MSQYPPPPGSPQYPQEPYQPGPYPQAPYGNPAPQYGAPPQYGTPAQYGSPAPAPAPKKSGGKGCLIAVLVFVVLIVGGIIAAMAGVFWLGNKVVDAVGSAGPCPYVTDAEASEAVGTDADAMLFTGGIGKLLNVTDLRVLPDKESCILTQTTSSSNQNSMPGLGRTVKYEGADAASLYERELTKANGISEDRGNGVTVESEKYFNHDVTGLGDKAFCTKTSGTLAGVLVLEGDTLVYVALTQAGTNPGLDLDDPSNGKLSTDDPACEASQVLARKILAKG